jgi:hypothetical protein
MKRSSRAVAEHFVVWLSTTRMGTLTLWLVESIAFGLGALVMMFIMYQAETRLFPVIRDWRLNPVVRQGDLYILQGTMVKTRPCTLLATSIMAVPKIALAPRVTLYQIKPTEIDGGQLPTGASTWGPWQMHIPKAFLENRDKIAWIDVIGHHRCHGFWDQETYYGRVNMEQLP